MKRIGLWMALALGLGQTSNLFAAELKALIAGPSSQLWLTGDSTLHTFASSATAVEVSGSVEPAPAGLSEAAVEKGAVKALDVVIPVEKLKSGEKGLDRNMYRALKSDANKEIKFHLEGYEVAASSAPITLKAKGKLSIAGKENPVELHAAVRFGAGELVVSGTQDILMTDYGVTPPKLMFGAIKVKNKIVVHYDLHLRLKE